MLLCLRCYCRAGYPDFERVSLISVGCLFCPEGWGTFKPLISPIRARYFSLLRQRKVSKRKAIPEACPLRGSPALLVKPGARATRCAQTGRELPPAFTAMLGCARRVGGIQNQNQNQHQHQHQHQHLKPAAPTRCTHRVPQPVRDQARTLFERIEHREIASCARPRSGEERRGSAQPMSAPGALLFGYFLLGKQEKVPRPSGRNKR